MIYDFEQMNKNMYFSESETENLEKVSKSGVNAQSHRAKNKQIISNAHKHTTAEGQSNKTQRQLGGK